MKIEPGTVVNLSFDLCDERGEIIEASDISGAISFIHGRGAIIPGLDRRLAGLGVGDERDFTFPPEEAFGRLEAAPKKTVARNEFPAEAPLVVGAEFEAGLPGGQKVKLVVDAIEAAHVTVRMVHPLAGQTVSMSVKVLGVRTATAHERETGKVALRPPPPPQGI
ncbi:MAG: FKBP-type peptidyl-prolyl cis-trans isomerase [Myxococcales bacterium]|nr:FKBP-type peptidyl-prolyl cis-trans isomerase [Myxococcales bacterium]